MLAVVDQLAQLLLGVLPALAPAGAWDTGIATLFKRGHVASGGKAACHQHGLVRRLLPRDGHIRDDAALAATRDARRYPCGSRIEVFLPRTGRRAVVLVADRGPAGVVCAGARRLGTREELRTNRLPPGCAWSADLDLTAGAHQALGGDGFEWLKFRPLHPQLARLPPASRRPAP